jgi:hypothetical protein
MFAITTMAGDKFINGIILSLAPATAALLCCFLVSRAPDFRVF